MSKSPVAIETRFCPICGKEWETGSILMHKQGRARFDRNICTTMDLCPDHRAQIDSGEWIALIEAERVIDRSRGTAKYDPTGNGGLLKKEVAVEIFGDGVAPINYVEIGVLQQLQKMTVPKPETE